MTGPVDLIGAFPSQLLRRVVERAVILRKHNVAFRVQMRVHVDLTDREFIRDHPERVFAVDSPKTNRSQPPARLAV